MAAYMPNSRHLKDNEALNNESTETAMDTYHEDIGCLASFEEELPPATKTSCAIDELKNAFGSILLSRRNSDPVSDFTTSSEVCSEYSANRVAETAIVQHWTGHFDLFAFPRELRDRIYFHYLDRPKGLLYRRNTRRAFPFDDYPEDVASLFLTSHQIYDEAFLVFCRYTIIEFNPRARIHQHHSQDKVLAGVIRIFPDKPARHLQHLGVSSDRYIYYAHWRFNDQRTTKPTDAFAQMLRDAYIFKDMFPKMRDFTVSFNKYDHFFGYPFSFEVEGQDEEEKITNCADIMSNWLSTDTVLPPRWFRFRFDEDWRFYLLIPQENIWNQAYERLARDRANKVESAEESGKVWLERRWGEES